MLIQHVGTIKGILDTLLFYKIYCGPLVWQLSYFKSIRFTVQIYEFGTEIYKPFDPTFLFYRSEDRASDRRCVLLRVIQLVLHIMDVQLSRAIKATY